MDEIKEITPEQLRRMQLLELEMVEELDRVCRKHNIKYSIDGGTLIGAVRHHGFIPWDDDMDIVMLREEYEKFKKVAHEMNPEVCYFQDHDVEPEYIWGYGKLRRTGTTFVRLGQEHLKCRTGIFVDVFPMDDVPKSLAGQMFVDFYCFCMRKILWAQVAKENETGFWKIWFKTLAKISPDWVFKRLQWLIKRSRNDSPNLVRVLLFVSNGKLHYKSPLKQRYGMPKKWLLELAEYDFEGKKFWGTKDYDSRLYYQYGDYMKLPPEEKRVSHIPFSSCSF